MGRLGVDLGLTSVDLGLTSVDLGSTPIGLGLTLGLTGVVSYLLVFLMFGRLLLGVCVFLWTFCTRVVACLRVFMVVWPLRVACGFLQICLWMFVFVCVLCVCLVFAYLCALVFVFLCLFAVLFHLFCVSSFVCDLCLSCLGYG